MQKISKISTVLQLDYEPLESAPKTRSHLTLIGGGPRPGEAMRLFLERARPDGSGSSRILVITWASEIPEETFSELAAEMQLLGAPTVIPALRPPVTDEEKKVFLADLLGATGVFFSGGDQNRIMDVLVHPTMFADLKRRYAEGIPFAGTSAGTAIMSCLMISSPPGAAENSHEVIFREGLGLLPGTILDQHFLKRGREPRLFNSVLHHPERLGIGVDEGAALVISEGYVAEAFGGPVMLIESVGSGNIKTKLLFPGERHDLRARTGG